MPAPLEPELIALIERRHGPRAALDLRREPLRSAEAFSDAPLERLVVRDAAGTTAAYVVKRLAPLGDWLSRATRDDRLREQRVVADGLLNELPAGVGSAVLDGAALPDGRGPLLMRDVTDALAPPGHAPFSDAHLDLALGGLAALHSAFAGFPAERAERIGLTALGDALTLLSPRTARREEALVPAGHLTRLFIPAWERVAALAPAAWAVLGPLLDDPAPLIAALESCPQTLAHGDAKAGNVAFEPGRLILLDWAMPGRRPGALDLVWFVTVNAAKLPRGRADAIERYRAARERLGVLPARGPAWERELTLALLGGALLATWQKVFGLESDDAATRARERAEFDFWTGAALSGARPLR